MKDVSFVVFGGDWNVFYIFANCLYGADMIKWKRFLEILI